MMAADEEKNENVEEQNDTPVDDAPKDDAPKDDAPKDDAPKDDAPKDDAPKDDAASEDAPESDAPADEAAGDDAPAAGGDDAGDGGGDEELNWKDKARLERSRQPHEARPQRSPEERLKERAEKRKQAGKNRSAYRKKSRAKKEKSGEGTPVAERETVGRKVRQGLVVSSKADKTITVRIDVARRHPVYEKIVRRSQTLHAHDERNEAGDGDFVQIVETRPISKTKRWRLAEILEKAK
jgi:small subunit ribosomal protein S17